ncbi:putative cytochrome P450 4d14 [Portunus trituberculatus]|uniref:Cholesterol side-chain cleavage enzyme, mitochondrial n=1 Tax=Portunus trituberculatus TaxID=210409 RepID=A0A5B7CNH0_PORTR|nr:putative cytochrome P450 4d14 [Portunus trituberculatus]
MASGVGLVALNRRLGCLASDIHENSEPMRLINLTSHTMAFTLYLLARNPEVQAKLQQEVDTVVGKHDGPLTVRHLAQFSYMKAVIKESFRIFPLVIGTSRTLDKDLILDDYLIPKGVMQRFTVDYQYEDIEGLTSMVFVPSQPLRFNLTERS